MDKNDVVVPQQDYVCVRAEDGLIVIEQGSFESGLQKISFLPVWARDICDAIAFACDTAKDKAQ